LTADGDIVSNPARLSSPTGTVTLQSNLGSITVAMDAHDVTANAPSGFVSLTDPNDVNFAAGSSTAAGQFRVIASGSISTTGAVTADEILFVAGGAITVGADVTGTTSVELSAAGGNVVTSGCCARVRSPAGEISLFSTYGSINVRTDAGTLLQAD